MTFWEWADRNGDVLVMVVLFVAMAAAAIWGGP